MTAPITVEQFYGATSAAPAPAPKTPPRSAAQQLPQSTPFHHRMSTHQLFTTTLIFDSPALQRAALEMKGKYILTDPGAFLDLLPERQGMPQVDFVPFRKIAKQETEPKMYQPTIEALSPFVPESWLLVNTSRSYDASTQQFFTYQSTAPDISLYSKKSDRTHLTCYEEMELFIEQKNVSDSEPFDDSNEGKEFERDTVEGKETRGQLAQYLNAIQSLQHRTRVFGVYMNQSDCRLLCHTRSGTLVTTLFDYTQTNHLQEFFWRFSHATPSDRGRDPSFKPVLPSMCHLAIGALGLGGRIKPPLFEVHVPDIKRKGKFRRYIVSEPFTVSHYYPIGRGTQCYKAFDCELLRIVVLKVSWRVLDYTPEHEIYAKLHEHNVPNIPTILAAGDIKDHSCGDIRPGWRETKGNSIRKHVQYMIVMDLVGKSITECDSTRDLVKCWYHALEAHRVAVEKAGVLHRDISVGNIVVMDGKGYLIDWELAKELNSDNATTWERTGTRQFISCRLLMMTTGVHGIGDDLESFLLVLLWLSIRHVSNELSAQERQSNLSYFDVGPGKVTLKKNLIGAGSFSVLSLKFNNGGLQDLLCVLIDAFSHRYGSITRHKKEKTDPKGVEDLLNRTESHSWMVQILADHLKDPNWGSPGDKLVINEVDDQAHDLTAEQRKRKQGTDITRYREQVKKHKLWHSSSSGPISNTGDSEITGYATEDSSGDTDGTD